MAVMTALFAEELGLVLEVDPAHEEEVAAAYRAAGLPVNSIGSTTNTKDVDLAVGGIDGLLSSACRLMAHCLTMHSHLSACDTSSLDRDV